MLNGETGWLLDLPDGFLVGMTAPWTIALGLAVLTLVLEDAAIAAGVLLVGDGAIGLPLAFLAVAGGIASGDMLLYLLGAAARRIPFIRHRIECGPHAQRAHRLLMRHQAIAVVIGRVVPGLRLAIYTVFGLVRAPFVPFALLVLAAVAIWTGALFWLGGAGVSLAQRWGVPVGPAAVAFFVLLSLVPMLVRRAAAATRRNRR